MDLQPKKISEAALFMSTDPVDIKLLAEPMGIESIPKAKRIVEELMHEFNSKELSLEIIKVGDSRYRMQVKKGVLPKVSHFAISSDLSKPVLRTLAIIAFKQPIRQSIIVKLRGNKSYDHIHTLEQEGFIKRTKEANTFLVETTKKFEEYFGPPIKSTDSEIKLVPKSRQATLEDESPPEEAPMDPFSEPKPENTYKEEGTQE